MPAIRATWQDGTSRMRRRFVFVAWCRAPICALTCDDGMSREDVQDATPPTGRVPMRRAGLLNFTNNLCKV